MSKGAKIDLPDGVRVSLTLYFYSERDDVTLTYGYNNMRQTTADVAMADITSTVEAARETLSTILSDGSLRLMTDAEVTLYLENEDRNGAGSLIDPDDEDEAEEGVE